MEDSKQEAEFAQLEAMIEPEQEFIGAGEQAAQQDQPETAEILKPLLEMGFGILAPNWNVQPEETEQLSIAYAGLVDKYFPDGLGDHGVEINAIMITAAIVLPRMRIPRKAEPQEQQAEGSDDAQA